VLVRGLRCDAHMVLMRIQFASIAIPLVCAACSGGDDGGTEDNLAGGGGVATGGTPGSGGTSGGSGGGLSLGGGTSSGGTGAGGSACVAQSAKAELQKQAVDVIVVADTSSSMGAVTNAIELNINTKLIDTLETAKLDYRVVLLAGYGAGSAICVTAPLGGGNCSPVPAVPALTPRFLHYDQATGSGSFFTIILSTYNQADKNGFVKSGWSEFLREGSKKIFLAFTDAESGPSMSGAVFDQKLLALTPARFGTATQREYVFHTFAGVATPPNPSQPWLPTDPVAGAGCGHPKAQPLQDLSILSGGLRYPLCNTKSYDVVFKTIADDVVKKVTVSCEFPFPEPPAGETLDPDTIQIQYTPGTGGKETFKQVKSKAECTAGAFYVEGQKVLLCDEACSAVQSDPGAALAVEYGCDVGFVK